VARVTAGTNGVCRTTGVNSTPWWEKSTSGKLKFEGGRAITWSPPAIARRWSAIRERTITVDALKASFERNPSSAPE
jgi:hypothetical protein